MAAVAVVYFATAKLGLDLASATPSVTAIWPPTGVALAALVLGGRRLWPAVAVGAFAANATTDVPVYTAAGIAVGNTLEAVVGASLLAWARVRPSLDRLRDVFGFAVLAGVVATTVSATIGVASLSLGDALSSDALSTWRLWWLGDMGGALLVAPFLLVMVTHWPYREVPGRRLEALALLVASVVVSVIAFRDATPLGFLSYPIYIWAALRFLQPGAAVVSLIVATYAVAYTASGDSQFVVASEDDSLLLAEMFSAVIGLSALILAALTSQRLQAEQAARGLASALQTELLPPALPDIPRIETAAWYRAGMRGQEVGGDFYDVFESAPNGWMAVIGDVCGKGPEAASLTALARYTLRAVGCDPVAPSDALRTLNRAILEQRSDDRFMTVAAARIASEDGADVITVSVGGHPLPLLARANGEVTEVGEPGTLLGVYSDPKLADSRIALAPGDALVLFTDGLSERRNPRDEATARIRTALGASAGAPAREIAERLQDAALGPAHDADDDVALLVLRRPLHDAVARGSDGPGEAIASGTLEAELDPVPASAAYVREAFAALRPKPDDDTYTDIELVLTELVTNSIRHGRLGDGETIQVTGAVSDGVLRVEVSDLGPGFDPRTPRPAGDETGGWGLVIAERLTDRWGVRRDGARSTVWLERDLGRGERTG
jgi:integral membrane sensor domain MASE1/anti-sigma regulatory factor (Ser/Thr protein kinase)